LEILKAKLEIYSSKTGWF